MHFPVLHGQKDIQQWICKRKTLFSFFFPNGKRFLHEEKNTKKKKKNEDESPSKLKNKS